MASISRHCATRSIPYIMNMVEAKKVGVPEEDLQQLKEDLKKSNRLVKTFIWDHEMREFWSRQRRNPETLAAMAM
jgi:hypothetical protein